MHAARPSPFDAARRFRLTPTTPICNSDNLEITACGSDCRATNAAGACAPLQRTVCTSRQGSLHLPTGSLHLPAGNLRLLQGVCASLSEAAPFCGADSYCSDDASAARAPLSALIIP